MKWYQDSSEVAFRLFGKEMERLIPQFLRLKDYYAVDICDIDLPYKLDPDLEDFYKGKPKEREEFIDAMKIEKYRKNFENLNTAFIYTLSTFLWFRDEVKEIEIHDEKSPMSLYVFYVQAVKTLGDVVGIFREIEDLLVKSRITVDRALVRPILSAYFNKHMRYAKEYRNFLTHRYFGRFFIPDCGNSSSWKVAHLELEDFKQFPEDIVLSIYRRKVNPSEELNDLLVEVAKGVDLRSKYIIEKVILKR